MLLVAADTTTPNGSVALARAGEVLGEVRLGRQEGHSATLLPAIEFLLRSMGLVPAAVDVWAVATGPGSFTGLRVGLSTIQGLALAGGKACVGVSALHANAARATGRAPRIVALMEAFRQEVYGQQFDAGARPLGGPDVGRVETLLERVPPGAAFVGDAVAAWRTEIESRCAGASFPLRSPFLAGEVARIAWREAAAGRTLAPDALRPLYLREAEAKKPSSA
ncbi:MAG TPA: tRNA (adenosine(37)-N6)-threonylcarbamoyltransferase complex dimerization subunit type 1 TsaB [Vicinamibacteria bacterium]|nr:tRNA (adenosine(37)-N6)-threonylcarbamoyltransferase complex dimerization subunit type 1 TsaB [Vicinamibacteria bacterium]